MNRSKWAVLLIAASLAGACGGDDPVLAGNRAEVSVTLSPETVRATANTGGDAASHPFAATFDVIIQESGGVSCNMISQALVAAPDPGNIRVRATAPSAAIGAGGSLRFPMTIVYTKVPSGGSMIVSLTVNVLDARGNMMSAIGIVRVNV